MNQNERLQSPEIRMARARLLEIEDGIKLLQPFDIQAAADKQRFDMDSAIKKQNQAANEYLNHADKTAKHSDRVSAGVASLAVESEANNVEAARRAVAQSHLEDDAVIQAAIGEFGNAN